MREVVVPLMSKMRQGPVKVWRLGLLLTMSVCAPAAPIWVPPELKAMVMADAPALKVQVPVLPPRSLVAVFCPPPTSVSKINPTLLREAGAPSGFQLAAVLNLLSAPPPSQV